MLTDIVVDTNTFVHPNNGDDPKRQKDCTEFLISLQGVNTQICIDNIFDVLVEANNRSIIGREYHQHIRHGMLGYAVLVDLAQSKRIKIVPIVAPSSVIRKLNQRIRNKHDRIVVRVALNAADQVVVSHDFDDFPEALRKELSKEIKVRIVTSKTARSLLK